MAKKEDPSSGLETLAKPPEVTIGGKTYKIRRLGILDVLTVLEIIQQIFDRGSKEMIQRISGMDLSNEENFAAALFYGFPACKESLLHWLADLVGVAYEDYVDPEQFPLDAQMDILEALASHPDLASFFTRVKELAEKKGLLQQIQQKFTKDS